MSRKETFFLITGALGIFADIVSLATFSWALGSAPSGGQSHEALAPLWLGVALILVNLYGWLSISWWLARRFLLSQQRLAQEDSRESWAGNVIAKAVAGVGILVLPIWAACWGAWIYTTLTESSMVDPITICVFLLAFLFLMGVVIWLALAFLMPLVYTDMEDVIEF